MVQKYESPVRIYKYPFELVVAVSTLGPHAVLLSIFKFYPPSLVPDF